LANEPGAQGVHGSMPVALYVPGAHCARDVQASGPGPEQVRHDGSHAAQVASSVALQDPERYSPSGQLVVHAVQVASAVAVQDPDRNSPAGQLVVHGVQVVSSEVAVQVPDRNSPVGQLVVHGMQVGSVVAVQDPDRYWPAGQLVVQGAQVLSVVGVQDPDRCWPAGQLLVHSVQLACPGSAANDSFGHSRQSGNPACGRYVPGAHGSQLVCAL
jgi:hypothetical protein